MDIQTIMISCLALGCTIGSLIGFAIGVLCATAGHWKKKTKKIGGLPTVASCMVPARNQKATP